MTKTILAAALLTLSLTVFGQNQLKLGHVDINEILLQLPERDSALAVLEKEKKGFESAYEEMIVIYNNLLEDYQKGSASYSDLVRQTKESELADKQKRIAEFEQNASTTLQNRNLSLIQPIIDKIMKAIDKIAKENSFTYVLDKSKGAVVFASSDSQDLNPLVLKALKP